ncbi:MAG: alpha/beta hydrolase [Armatimonadota bacterium]
MRTGADRIAGRRSGWHGFERIDFRIGDADALVVLPSAPRSDGAWIQRAEFFDHRPELDLALLARGFNLGYVHVGNTFGCPSAMRIWERFHDRLASVGLSRRPVLEGLSRGGLYVHNFAAANPHRVGCILGDNPVCDFKSWPGGKGVGPGSPPDWRKMLVDYGFRDESEALAYRGNPVDTLGPVARARVPVIHVAGDADEGVPFAENSRLLIERYRALGGPARTIVRSGYKHHPHGLDDPSQLVGWIENAVEGRWR